MYPKSIQNASLVNLTNCDSEPIHIPGSIQPHGFLLALDKNYDIRFCSENLPDFNISITDALNHHITAIFEKEAASSLITYLDHKTFSSTQPHVLRHEGISYCVNIHISGDYYIMEAEPFPDGNLELSNLYLQTKKFTAILSEAVGLQELCQDISEEVKKLTGYDRVMIYRFDEHYNGEVFAEAKNEELESFLGLHYPHTDIPTQARQLYLTNLMRMIADVSYQPVSILTLDKGATHQTLDLGMSFLRSVSPIHIEYLKNMGVSATLTISLITEGKLWGLIACHHYSPKNIPHYIRLSSLLQGHFLTSQIKVQEVAADYKLKLLLDERLKAFLNVLDSSVVTTENNFISQELIDLTNSHGVCFINETQIYSSGIVPYYNEIQSLLSILNTEKQEFIASQNILKDYSIKLSNDVSGLLYYKLDNKARIIWFRKELKQIIHWAGEPDKTIEKNENGLSPRKSFEAWKQIISESCSPWLEAEITIANQGIYALQKQISILRSKQIQETQSKLLKKLEQANEELENINWISTHDLKEPLRKISIFSSMLLERHRDALDEDMNLVITKIATSAFRMQTLLDDLMSFGRLKNGQFHYEICDFNKIINSLILENEDIIKEKNILIQVGSFPKVYCIEVLIKQVFANLISNSIKFARPNIPLIISISCRDKIIKGIKYLEITVSDNGKGFDNKYKSAIFHIFRRLDNTKAIEGTGIGLAICKKITEIHKGNIEAEGTLNKGATFKITLPFNPDEVRE
jgi:light-regulated signal transduction histidine kinase (bacteriophytochrome)